MILENSLLIAFALFLVLLNGFFVAAEFAMVKLRHTRVTELKASKGWRGSILARVHGHLDAYLSACQLGITLASLGLGWVGEPAFAHLLEPLFASLGVDEPALLHTLAFVVSFGIISFLHIVVGELAPKSLAIREPEAMSLWTAVPLFLFYWAMLPFIFVLNASANWLLRRTGLSQGAGHHGAEAPYSNNELRAILHLSRPGHEEGGNSDVNRLLTHTLDLPALEVSDVMHSRREMVALTTAMGHAEVQALLLGSGYSRYPLLDAGSSEILGVIHLKDIFATGPGPDFAERLRAQLRPALQVRENEPLLGLLTRFRQGAPHLALVVDESAFVIGFATLEDVLEVIFGEISDEHETGRGKEHPRRIQRVDAQTLRLRGSLPLYRLERALGYELVAADSEISTVGGLITDQLGRMARAGDVVELAGTNLHVEKTSGPRVEWVRVKLRQEPGATEA